MQGIHHYPTFSPRLDRHRWFNGSCMDCGCSQAVGFKRSEECVPNPDLVGKAIEIVPKSC
jgi:hypothetical protein